MPENSSNNPNNSGGGGEDTLLNRRAFVQAGFTMVGACYASAIGYPVYRYLSTPARRASAVAAVSEVSLPGAQKLEAGSAMIFKFGTKPALLIHHKDGSWVAMDAVCTHLGCTVQYEPAADRIFCACHGGVYNAHTGETVSGPPPKPLTKFTVEVSDAQIVVKRA